LSILAFVIPKKEANFEITVSYLFAGISAGVTSTAKDSEFTTIGYKAFLSKISPRWAGIIFTWLESVFD